MRIETTDKIINELKQVINELEKTEKEINILKEKLTKIRNIVIDVEIPNTR